MRRLRLGPPTRSGAVAGKARGERGTALIEAALTIPLLLLIAVGIFDFGRAYQTWQIVTNAAREGARIAVLPGTEGGIEDRVKDYLRSGQLPNADAATVVVNRADSMLVNGASVSASRVTVTYPFTFIAVGRVARLIRGSTSTIPNAVDVQAVALMRNEW